MSVNSKHARVEIVVDGTDIMVIKAEMKRLKAENERLNAMVVHLLEKKVVDLCGRVVVMEKMKQEADTEWPTFSPQGADDDS